MLAARPEPDFHTIRQGDRLAVAVSGGSDSLALLLLTKEFCAVTGNVFTALTFDHGLRPESRAEAEWVVTVCGQIGVSVEILSWDGPKPITGIQAKARDARYAALTRWCAERDYSVLLTAHTRDDQAETVAMRLKRSRSPRSLAAIWPENYMSGTRIVRPLLGTSKAALRDYLMSLDQKWLEDSSNNNSAFERVRIRQELSGGRHRELSMLAADSQAEVEWASDVASTWFKSHVTVHPQGYFSFLRSAIGPLRGIAFEHVLRGLIFALSGRRPKTSDGLARIVSWVRLPGASRTTVAGVIVARRARTILLMREPGRFAEPEMVIPASGEVVWDNRFIVTGPASSVVKACGKAAPQRNVPSVVVETMPVSADGTEIGIKFAPRLDFG